MTKPSPKHTDYVTGIKHEDADEVDENEDLGEMHGKLPEVAPDESEPPTLEESK